MMKKIFCHAELISASQKTVTLKIGEKIAKPRINAFRKMGKSNPRRQFYFLQSHGR